MSASMHQNGEWVPLLQYAAKKSQSISTLRRRIKSNKIRYKLENGRYFLWESDQESQNEAFEMPPLDSEEIKRALELKDKLNLKIQELRNAKNEIAELKTLIALYEEKIQSL